jgi:probable dihydroxyacetone kinase regulator
MTSLTKKALAQSLKKLIGEKEINKITIKDITEDCGVNRQTFYYHFSDIYDLLQWIYKNEVIEKIDNIQEDNFTENWQACFLYVFEYILDNKQFVINIYYSLSRDLFLNFIYKQTDILLSKAIEEKSKQKSITLNDKKFITTFYKYAIVGLVQDWIEKGMKEDPKKIIDKLNMIIDSDFNNAVSKLSY